MNPRISIIIPHYNRGAIIGETLASIQQQSYPDFECLIIDDHSTDDSVDVIRDIIRDDPRFVLKIRQSQVKGAPACRNEGLEMAGGVYVMFLDSDDLLASFCLEQRVELFANCPEKDFIVVQTGKFKDSEYLVDQIHSSLLQQDDLQAFIHSEGWGTSSTFFRRSFVSQYRFDEQAMSWQDIEFHIRMLLTRPDYRKFPDSRPDVYKRFSRADQISATNISYVRLDSLLRLLLRLEKDLQARQVPFRHAFLIYYFKFLEIGARVGKYEDFQHLMHLWNNSATFTLPLAILLRLYLSSQALLSKFGLYKLGSPLYRMIRLFLPKSLLYQKAKNIPMQEPVKLNKPEGFAR